MKWRSVLILYSAGDFVEWAGNEGLCLKDAQSISAGTKTNERGGHVVALMKASSLSGPGPQCWLHLSGSRAKDLSRLARNLVMDQVSASGTKPTSSQRTGSSYLWRSLTVTWGMCAHHIAALHTWEFLKLKFSLERQKERPSEPPFDNIHFV